MEVSNIPADYYHGSSDYPKTGKTGKLGEGAFLPVEDITEDHLPEGWGTKSPEELLEEAEEAHIEGVGASEYVDLAGGKLKDEEEEIDEGDDDKQPKMIGMRKKVEMQKDFPHRSVKDVRQEKSTVRGKNSK
ncbi:MAG TPA: hypothetical protein PLV72_03240 [Candidatus Magasanikbacteria bacterium]|nr:hypothetical protein [Candidatus Magasanikbacteria bacterium]